MTGLVVVTMLCAVWIAIVTTRACRRIDETKRLTVMAIDAGQRAVESMDLLVEAIRLLDEIAGGDVDVESFKERTDAWATASGERLAVLTSERAPS